MLWGLLDGVRGRKQEPTPQTLANKIDEYFDSLLFEGMPMEQALWVEDQRAAAHAEVTREAIAAALDGWQRPGRIG